MADTIVTLGDGLEHLVTDDDYTPCGQFAKGVSPQNVESTTNPCPVCFPKSKAKKATKEAA